MKKRLTTRPLEILVTGGAGFIGSNFVHLLNREYPQHKITVVDKLSYCGRRENLADLEGGPNYRFVKEDIADYQVMSRLITPGMIVVNFAAESHVDNSIKDPLVFSRTNVLGTHSVLEAARVNKAKLFVQISTDEVYGSLSMQSGASLETDPLRPSSPYSASKASADMLCLANVRTFQQPVIITRSSNNYGPNQYPEKVIPLFITNLLEGKNVPLYGNGTNVRDWIFVEDNCQGILRVINQGTSGEIYHIGGGNEIPNIDLTHQIIKAVLGHPDPSRVQPVPDRLGHDLRYAINSSKLHALGWMPRTSFGEGLNKTVAWYREHPDWWKPLKQGREK